MALATALVDRFRQDKSKAVLDLAISAFKEAVPARPPGHIEHLRHQSNLAAALGIRFEHYYDLADADEAVTLLTKVVAELPREARSAGMFSNRAAALLGRARNAGDVEDAEAAVAAASAAVEMTPPENPERAAHLFNLGRAHALLFSQFSRTDALSEGLAALRSATAVAAAPAYLRVGAARDWGRLAWSGGDPHAALAGFELSIELLPVLAWHGQDRGGQERVLAEVAGLASQATAAALATGAPERGIELLDAGRSVLWTQLLQIRTDITALSTAAPQLAEKLDQIRSLLDPHDGWHPDGYPLNTGYQSDQDTT
jgi:tetratricopeptide (TPR) repeat protein